jgi:uncharacterized protein YndB with AHSA1/START domain
MTERSDPIAFEVPPIVKQVTIAKPADQVFRMFTAEIDRWWPLKAYSVGKETAKSCAIEPRVGGRVFERSEHGVECDWGKVLTWDPPRTFACSWHPPHAEHPIKAAQRVEVRFVAEAPAVTRVELVHSGWEANADGQKLRDAYNGGWVQVFDVCFKNFAAS